MGSKGKRRFKAPQAPMMRQLQQLQQEMVRAQESLAETVVTATVGGGAVTIEMTGNQQVRAVSIKPEVIDPEDAEMLEDLVMAAFKEAQEKARNLAAERFGPLAGGMDISGLV